MNYRKRRDLMSSIFWWAALIYLVGFWWVAGALLYHALAHEAVTGWQYPLQCCAKNDCGEISSKAVIEGPDGYTLNLTPADHPMIAEPTTIFIPYGDPRIKDSPDGLWHWCGHRQLKNPQGKVIAGGDTICFFAPPRSM